ncbi:hypothetical protein HpKG12_12390 [Helicobacter pylori]
MIFTGKLITDCLLGLSLLLAILTTLFDIDNKTKKLESCFRDAIKHPFYCPFTIGKKKLGFELNGYFLL